jgi:hypothetical protein
MEGTQHAESRASRVAPRGAAPPRIATCEPQARARIEAAYRQAYAWAVAAQRWLARLVAGGNVRSRWNGGVAGRLFGPFRAERLRRVVRVLGGLLRRFREGYLVKGRRVPATIACFSTTYHRCGKGLLGNASIYGTIRLCPQLLRRPVDEVAAIVLHELMHQRLGVGDRRHESCAGSKRRCYRDGATDLVEAGRHDLALRNIDNFVAFARHVATRN